MSEADDRRAKLERLRAQGIDPFPHEFEGVAATSSVGHVHSCTRPPCVLGLLGFRSPEHDHPHGRSH